VGVAAFFVLDSQKRNEPGTLARTRLGKTESKHEILSNPKINYLRRQSIHMKYSTNNSQSQRNFSLGSQPEKDSMHDLLEATKLSRLPPLPKRNQSFDNAPTSRQAATTTCGGGSGRIDSLDHIQESVGACRKCICIYTKVEALFEKSEKRHRLELLEKFVGGVQ
jgi:hypothetical protein